MLCFGWCFFPFISNFHVNSFWPPGLWQGIHHHCICLFGLWLLLFLFDLIFRSLNMLDMDFFVSFIYIPDCSFMSSTKFGDYAFMSLSLFSDALPCLLLFYDTDIRSFVLSTQACLLQALFSFIFFCLFASIVIVFFKLGSSYFSMFQVTSCFPVHCMIEPFSLTFFYLGIAF
jgi:hypothetical protein